MSRSWRKIKKRWGGDQASSGDGNGYAQLLESGAHSGFVIQVIRRDGDGDVVERTEIKVHRAVLSAGSSVFRTMLDSGMTETKTGILTIEDLNVACVRVMLSYIYTGRLDGSAWNNVGGELVHAADKYDLQRDEDGVVVERTELKVHRNILATGSSVFKTMLDSGMKEAEIGILTIEDLSLSCVKIMLKYIYTGRLEDDWKNVADELVRAADKYDLAPLLNYLDRNFHFACTPANALNLRRVAKLHELTIATRNIGFFIVANIDQIL